MKILITGGSGFIGTNLVDFYLQQGVDVINVDVAAPRNPKHHTVWRKLDITDTEHVQRIFEEFDPDYCFHLAARTDLNGATIDDYAANTVGVRNVISALSSCKSLKFTIFASSMLVCKIGYRPAHETDYCPTTAYGESKVEGERFVRDLATGRFAWVIVRPTSIWGPWFSTPYKDFFTAVRKGFYHHPRGYRINRSYGFVLNTIFQLDELRTHLGGRLLGKAVYLADYTPTELHGWGTLIQQRLNSPKIREVPITIFKMGAWMGDILKLFSIRFPLTSFRLNNMLTETIHDTGPLQELTGTLPYTTEEGVIETCEWLVAHDTSTI